ncbi:hypothetical protein BN3658_02670 [Coriobacteriaceae bacterium CHKCI002]|nr:hypothetical protein BN3658_02670 [Coriobacteriaceae bacterium CHKCI002]
MNAKESESNQTGALGRGLESLMARGEAKAPEAAGGAGAEGGRSGGASEGERPCDLAAAVGLVAGGAAGAVAVAAFTLLGVRAVLGMERGRPFSS